MFKRLCRGCGKTKNLARHYWWSPSCKAANESGSQCGECTIELVVVPMEMELPPPPLAAALITVDSACTILQLVGGLAGDTLHKSETMMRSLSDLNRWTTEAHIGDKWKTDIKDSVERNINRALDGVEETLRGGHHTTDEIMAILRERLSLFDGLRTPAQEEAAVKRKMPHLETFPRKVGPRADDIAYMTHVADWVQLKMNTDAR